MHELSFVVRIIDIAEKEARKAGSKSISKIELDIGKLSTIEPLAFDMAWKCGIKYSMLEDAECVINYITGTAICMDCENKFELSEYGTPCPNCGCYHSQIIEGKDLLVKSISVN